MVQVPVSHSACIFIEFPPQAHPLCVDALSVLLGISKMEQLSLFYNFVRLFCPCSKLDYTQKCKVVFICQFLIGTLLKLKGLSQIHVSSRLQRRCQSHTYVLTRAYQRRMLKGYEECDLEDRCAESAPPYSALINLQIRALEVMEKLKDIPVRFTKWHRPCI